MNIQDMPIVTNEQILAFRKAAIELQQENTALKAELEAVIAGLRSESYINKIKADAIKEFIHCINEAVDNDIISDREAEEMELVDFLYLAYKHANNLEGKK